MSIPQLTKQQDSRATTPQRPPSSPLPIIEQADGSYTRLSYEADFVPVGSDPTLLDIIARDGNESSWWYWYAGSADYIIRRLASRAPYRTEAFTDDNGGSYYRCTSTKDDKTWFYLYEVK